MNERFRGHIEGGAPQPEKSKDELEKNLGEIDNLLKKRKRGGIVARGDSLEETVTTSQKAEQEAAFQAKKLHERLDEVNTLLKKAKELPPEEESRLWKERNELEEKLGLRTKDEKDSTGVYL